MFLHTLAAVECLADIEQAQLLCVMDVQLVDGGLCCNSGISIPELGDKNDDMIIAVAAVTVGY